MGGSYATSPRAVKIWRWLRWKPWFFIVWAWYMARWATKGLPAVEDTTRLQTMLLLWRINLGRADFAMDNWLTMEEVMARLKSKFGDMEKP